LTIERPAAPASIPIRLEKMMKAVLKPAASDLLRIPTHKPVETIPADTRPNRASRTKAKAMVPKSEAPATTETKPTAQASRNRLESSSLRVAALAGDMLAVSAFAG
jgi:hypothetical protein